MQKGLSIFDLPEFARKMGFEGLEISDREILRFDNNLLLRLSQTSSQNNCGLILDVNTDLSYSNENLRIQEIKHVRRMIHFAKELNIGLLRICLGGQFISIQKYLRKRRKSVEANKHSKLNSRAVDNRPLKSFGEGFTTRLAHYIRMNTTSKIIHLEKKKTCVIKSLKEIVRDIDRYNIKIGIENHWGVSSRPEDIMEIIRVINSPYLGTCPDFGNFSKDVDPFKGLEMMAPKAVIVHAKCYGFDNDWKDKRVDFNRCLKIFLKAGYNGPVTVEYEGEGDDLKNCRIAKQQILNIF
jgi:sugar phosphate isomerase/epimerase